MPFAHHSIQKASRAASTFLLSAAWIVLSLAAAGEMARLFPPSVSVLAQQVIAAALLFAGFYAMSRMFLTDLRPLSQVGFVRRPGIGGEFARGLALGWAVAIALVLPVLLTGNLGMSFALSGNSLLQAVVSAATLCAFALLVQLILAGLPVRMLLKATSETWTVIAIVFVVSVLAVAGSGQQGRSLPVMVLAALLFVTGFLRTRAIWLSLGVQVGWSLSLALLFGASSPYTPPATGIILAEIGGPAWLTGSAFGPEASFIAVTVLIAALVALVRITRDYAWNYTWQPLEGAGRPVDIAPPAEHSREEAKQAAAAPLVQIAGVQSQPPTRSTES